VESHVEQSLRDRILQYLKVAGLKYKAEPEGAIYVGPLVVFIGPKGAEVHFRNLSQRYRLTSNPKPELTADLSGRSGWVEVVHATKDPEEVISYVDNLLNPAGAVVAGTSMPSELVLGDSILVRSDVAVLRIREEKALEAFMSHGSSCPTCGVHNKTKNGAAWDVAKLCRKGRLLHDMWGNFSVALFMVNSGKVM
jgi:hypothetical protein